MLFDGQLRVSICSLPQQVVADIYRTLICIPIGGEMLESVGKQAMVGFFGGVLIVALGMFLMARWACLGYRWRWQAKI